MSQWMGGDEQRAAGFEETVYFLEEIHGESGHVQ